MKTCNSKQLQRVLGQATCCLLISLLGILVYANHLSNTFQFDSVAYIASNANLKNPETMLTFEFWKKEFLARGLLRMSFALNASLDGFRPFGYHIFNLTFHILNTLLLFFVLEKSFRRFDLKAIGWCNKRIRTVAFFSAAIFLCHPIQTESVIYIMSRSEVIASTFYLAGFFLFQNLLERPSTSRSQYGLYFLIIFLIALVGFSVKQIVATLPAIMILYYFSSCSTHSPALLALKKWKWPVCGVFFGVVSLLIYKLLADETFLIGPSRPEEMVGRVKYMLSQPSVMIFYYLNKLLFPLNLSIDPDIEVITSFLSWKFLIPIICIAFFLAYSLKFFKNRFIFFYLCWFFIILSPSSSIVTLHDLAAEHRVYLASAGIITLFACGASELIYRFEKAKPLRISAILILFVVVGVLGIVTMKRNAVWQTELSLWQDAYNKSPHKLRPLINLARAHSIEGDIEKAIKFYQKSLIEGPVVFATHYNLADLYLNKGLVPDAIRHFQLASRIEPKIPETYAKLGEIYLSQKKFKLADTYFKRAVELHPNYSRVFKNLGIINFYHLNNHKQGLTYFFRSLTLNPDQPEADKIRDLLAQYPIH
ncbi:MAG: tetratricopeptide repeat protein [Nitrospina sp.]|jgi:protein O-mannosyl-transferase|nr:tetratricopeptide repeat protein [Nitrospina sp.]MBT3509391.1 tetratricopeptide repeat protein [Nitrospina sp.]MBT3875455.1 tetratricopeptide repeat protein [Nitrospina sp.]MBT4047278.1 tetratricopeptide repeat protein [Nitrospina sp.]MBT4556279.1 tetratricopeptide repeat protein [Nitrospina sp.]